MPDDRYFEPEIEAMPRQALAALQQERILELVPYVYERSALVRRKWEEARVKPSDINSLADFTERAPFITKDDIRQFRDQARDPASGQRPLPPPHAHRDHPERLRHLRLGRGLQLP